MKIEARIVHFFNRIGKNTVLNKITLILNYIPFLVALVFIIIIFVYSYDPANLKVFLASLIIVICFHFLISELIFKKVVVSFIGIRKRPYLSYSSIKGIGKKFSDSSFPSSHMSAITGILFIVSYFYPLTIIFSIIFLLFMAFSRIHNGMHYPSDVLAGFILGLFYGVMGLSLVNLIYVF
ncbi:MAG: phosphatase PAP2 family protein [Candidatus Pacearchaeota archaeon]|jgi:undecaprenyl-diphosphatase